MAITPRFAYAAPARGSAASTLRNAASAVSSSPRCSAASPSPKVFCRSAMPGLLVRAVRAWDTERNNISAEPSGGMAPTRAKTKRLAVTAGTRLRRLNTPVVSCRPMRNSSRAAEIVLIQGDSASQLLKCTLCRTTPDAKSRPQKKDKIPLDMDSIMPY